MFCKHVNHSEAPPKYGGLRRSAALRAALRAPAASQPVLDDGPMMRHTGRRAGWRRPCHGRRGCSHRRVDDDSIKLLTPAAVVRLHLTIIGGDFERRCIIMRRVRRLQSVWCEGATRKGRLMPGHALPIRARPVEQLARIVVASAARICDQTDRPACFLCTVAELLLRLMCPVCVVAARALGELARDIELCPRKVRVVCVRSRRSCVRQQCKASH